MLVGCGGESAPSAGADAQRTLSLPTVVAKLTAEHWAFGGISGLDLAEDARSLIGLTDRGWAVQIGKEPPFPVTGIQRLGGRLDGRMLQDSEALRRGPNGEWWLAFEGYHRLAKYRAGWAGLSQPPAWVFRPFPLNDLAVNRGIEALAILSDDRLVAIGESAGTAPMFVVERGRKVLKYKTYRSAFSPVDAVALDNGGLLILSRAPFWPLPPTFASQVEYVPPGWEELDVIDAQPLFRLDRLLPAENYEGMAVEVRDDHILRLWLVSDDNFLRLQETLLVRLDMPRICLDSTWICRPVPVKAPRPPEPPQRPEASRPQ